jgi:hypothetical protein
MPGTTRLAQHISDILCSMNRVRDGLLDHRRFMVAAAFGAKRVFAERPLDSRPPTLDLRNPLRLALSCLPHRMDPEANYRPWFAVQVEGGRPSKLGHEQWDFGDTTGRFLEAFISGRAIGTLDPEMLLFERRIRRYLDSLISGDGIVHNPETGAPDHMFSRGSTLCALVADYETSPSSDLRARIEHFVAGLDAQARHARDYLWFPQVATAKGPCSHQAAYQVYPVVRFFELTGSASALKYAEQLSRWAFYYDPTVTADGVITKTLWEGHLHAWMDTFTGIIRCARAGRHLDYDAVLVRARKLFEWVRTNYTSSFGWVADSVGSKTCETDTITSFMRLALELIHEGHTEYWNDVERFTRNQLVENQFRDVRRLGIRDVRTERGLDGAFESYADPNSLIANEKGTIEGCCIGGGIRGICLAYDNAIHETADQVRINLLLSHASAGVEVVSYLPFEGRLDLYPKMAKTVFIRCPDWLRAETIRLDGTRGLRSDIATKDRYLRITGTRPGSKIILRFDQPQEHRTHVVAGKTYTALWYGDTVVELAPPGARYPIYERASFRSQQG